jgi:hypothetical protein
MSGKSRFRFGVPLAVAFLAQASCGDTAPCPFGCPADHFFLEVTGAPGGGSLTGVEATLSGPMSLAMTCSSGTEASCSFTGGVFSGSYTLQVTAPGFQAANVPATLTVATDKCGCQATTFQPSQVTLNPLGDPDAAVGDAVDGGADGGQREQRLPDAAVMVGDAPTMSETGAEDSNVVHSGGCAWPENFTSTSDGSAVGCWAHTISGPADGGMFSCSSAEYSLDCVGELASGAPIPAPTSSLGCRLLPLPTPSNQSYYCCPCGQGE